VRKNKNQTLYLDQGVMKSLEKYYTVKLNNPSAYVRMVLEKHLEEMEAKNG